ncbi:MAG: TOBE domain-containing protein, partial [bacterium]
RAIVRKPKVFLFDEPLSNLDAKLRVQMRTELKRLHDRLQATMIYVTHDQTEAMTMGDSIVVMKDGLMQQVADPITLYDKPVNRFVAGFIGSPPMNFLDCKIIKKDEGLYFEGEGFSLKVPEQFSDKLIDYHNKDVTFGVRPEDIKNKLNTKDPTPDSTITAETEVVEPMGSEIMLHVRLGSTRLIARVDAHDKSKVGDKVEMTLRMHRIHVFDKDTEEAVV